MNSAKKDLDLSVKIAQRIKEVGGKAYFVGGFVRDCLMGKESTDIDIEVHGLEGGVLFDILSSFGTVLTYGKSFGIFSVEGYGVDIALPRTEKPTGKGHRDFEIHHNPFMGEKEAAKRRDFTINALMQDVLTGEVLDFFGGREDLHSGIIRHIDDNHFGEDPLRVLRGAQFAARLGFDTDRKTLEIYKKTDLTCLSRERVMSEMMKALMLSDKPSVFFESLRKSDSLMPWFKEIKDLTGIEQNPKYHAEGDVWNHTMMVLDSAVSMREKASDPRGFMLSALCHDFGKKLATIVKDGVIHAYNHERAGLPLIQTFLKRLTDEKALIKYVLSLCEMHMKPRVLAKAKSSVKATNKMFDSVECPMDLIYISKSDASGKLPREENSDAYDFLVHRYEVYRQTMAKPHVTAKDLMENGIEPNEKMGEILKYAHKLRLAGVDREDALKQCMTYKSKRGHL